MTCPRLLYIDAYDSFSNNIITLLESHLQASVSSIKIDEPRFVLNDDAFFHFLDGFDAVVAGPGPGHPANSKDIGLIAKLWTLPDEHLTPVLGICLGFQSLCLTFGASVERLREPRHGLVTRVTHCNRDVFKSTGDILATQYHSLHVRLGHHDDGTSEPWKPTKNCAEIVPLAWDLSDPTNGTILMAARHARKPFWGVQYHPESICTNEDGTKLVRQWWRKVCACKGLATGPILEPLLNGEQRDRVDSGRTSEDFQAGKVNWHAALLPTGADVVDLVDLLREDGQGREPLLLESGTREGAPVNAETGRFSMIGVHTASSTHVRYSTSSHRLTVVEAGQPLVNRQVTVSEVFKCLQHLTSEHKAIGGPENVPFWGGLVGYISYEAGLETIDVEPAEANPDHPDIWFVFVKRSVVVDHTNSVLYIQSLADDGWVDSTVAKLRKLSASDRPPIPPCSPGELVSEPSEEDYCAQVRDCQGQLRAGESYELCLTDTTLIRHHSDAWSLYRRLRALNPAPFGAYLSLSSDNPSASDLSIASSSPERFLSWTRDGSCQFRPIKGTVKKAPGVTRAQAEEILRSPKEQAENLMIVDLIRHDLSGVRGYVQSYLQPLSRPTSCILITDTPIQHHKRPRPQTHVRRRIHPRLPTRLRHRRHPDHHHLSYVPPHLLPPPR